MKKLYFGLLLSAASILGTAQINSVNNFDSGTASGWLQSGGAALTSTNTCSGISVRDNLYSGSATGTFVSPAFSESNGMDITVSFDYKIINYSGASTPPGTATPAGWGNSKLQYSVDAGATWTDLLTIDDSNHVVSTSCANKSATIPAGTVPVGTSMQVRFSHTWTAGDWYIYLDNVNIVQAFTAATVDWANLQWPPNGTITKGDPFNVYGQIYEAGVTEPAGQGAGVNAWVGYSTTNTDPATWTNWIPATYNTAGPASNNDEYFADLGAVIPAPGTYYYATRFNVSGGAFYYGGYNAAGGGAWDGTNNVNGVLTVNAPAGYNCATPIAVGALPYSTTNDTANFGDVVDGTPGATNCGSTSNYLNGNDVFYSFTPTESGTATFTLTPSGTYSGIFVYDSCASIGQACVAGAANAGTAPRVLTVTVTAGTTYYIVISTWPAPQTTAYQLDINMATAGVGNAESVNGVQLYPNPTNDVLNVKGMSVKEVTIYAMDGKLLSNSVSVEGDIINVKKLPVGSYVIQLKDKDGNMVSRRFIKK